MDKEEIIKNSRPLIIGSIQKYAISKGEFDDLYQDGVIKIIESLEDYDESMNISIYAYLKSKLKYYYLNYDRYKKAVYSLNETVDEDGNEIIDIMADESSDTESLIIEKEMLFELRSAIRSLDSEECILIDSLFIKKQTLQAIACHMNTSIATVYRSKEKILKKLRCLCEKS